MSKKHLTLTDRIIIQAGLQQHLSLAKIAERTGVSRSTVSREIKARRKLIKTSRGNSCTRVPDCRVSCIRGKRQCQSACGDCNAGCVECSMMRSQPRNSMRVFCQSPEKGSR